MGFYGMVEVALFADILTLKEVLEFDRLNMCPCIAFPEHSL